MQRAVYPNRLRVIGELPPDEAVAKLRELDEFDIADILNIGPAHTPHIRERRTSPPKKKAPWPFYKPAWQHTSHAFGFVATVGVGEKPLPIAHAGNITPDLSLREQRIKISLGQLRVSDYPGGSTHRILFDFYAQNQAAHVVEHLHWNRTFYAREGERAAVLNFPIFVGLNVGIQGVAFECTTVNVKNDADESFLEFLECDEFKEGLKLIRTVQPAVGPLSKMAGGLVRAIACRHRNVPVQRLHLGLDFGHAAFGARLAEGSYLAVQIPETAEAAWNWEHWVFDPGSGQVVSRRDLLQLIPYNYLVFNVTRHHCD